jgi:RNA polymerase sigma-70 factor (ECF subfamily)
MERHAGSVHRFLGSLAATPDDAEDALQECFLAAWRSADTYRGGESARAWLFSIARNALRRQHRRRVGEPAAMESLESLGAMAGWGDPSEAGARFEVMEELAWAMGQLPDEEREVVTLRDLEGLGGDETAEALGVTVAAMKSRLHRGRLRLMGVLRRAEAADA